MELINDYIFTRLKESMEAKLEELIDYEEICRHNQRYVDKKVLLELNLEYQNASKVMNNYIREHIHRNY